MDETFLFAGCTSAEDYSLCHDPSSVARDIAVPLLAINALDDPVSHAIEDWIIFSIQSIGYFVLLSLTCCSQYLARPIELCSTFEEEFSASVRE